MLRLSRPQSAYQEEVDARVAEALGEVAAVTASRDDELNRRVRGTREVLESRHESLRESLRRELADAVKRLPQLSERIEYLLQASADASTHVNALDEHVTGLQEFADRMTSQPDFERSRAIYPALGELGRRYGQVGTEPGPADGEADLSRFELRVFSQNGEDGVLAEILRRIGVGPQPFFVEFGIESGAEGNCVFLADVLGWSGLFIEADAEQYPRLEAKYRWSEPVQTLHAFVTPENADDLFTQAGVPEEPDILSIDIDGPDLWVWRSVARFRPRLVIIEVNSSLDPNRRLVQPPDHQWDKTEYQGASLGALEAVGREKGYRLVHVDLAGVNAFFVRDDLPGEWARPRPRGVNLYLSADGHPPDEERRAYLELDD